MRNKKLIFIGILALVGFWLGDKISYQVRTDLDAQVPITDVTKQFWKDLAEQPFHVSFAQPDLIAGAIVVFILFLFIAFQLSKRRALQHDGVEHGSARWGTPNDIKPFMDPDYRQNLLFTRTERLSLDSRKTQRNQHVLIIGSSGSGKTRYYVQPNMAQANQSYVVTDPNGEIMQATGEQLEANGYKVRSLNLVDWEKSETFNPLAYFTPGQAEVDATILVENIISNTSGKQPAGGNSGFWEKAERALLSALVAYIYGAKGSQGTFNDVTALLASMQSSEADENFISEGDRKFLGVEKVLEKHAAAFNPATAGKYSQEALNMLRMWKFAWSQYNIYTQGAGETKKSVLISLGVRLGVMHMPALSRLLSGNSIDAASVGKEKTALFLIIPDSHETFSFLVAVFYDMFFQKSIALADASPKKRLDVPIHCYMDEFANIGKLPSFHTKIAVMRKRGVAASVIMQNYAQGKSIYGEDWETIVGNCDSKLFLGGDEESTTQWFSKRLGSETIASRDDSEMRGGGGYGSETKSYRKLGRELLTPDEVARLDGSECLYFLRGVPGFRSKKLQAVPSGDYVYHTLEERGMLSADGTPADAGANSSAQGSDDQGGQGSQGRQPQSRTSTVPTTEADRARFAAARQMHEANKQAAAAQQAASAPQAAPQQAGAQQAAAAAPAGVN